MNEIPVVVRGESDFWLNCPIKGHCRAVSRCYEIFGKDRNCPHFSEFTYDGNNFIVLCNYKKKTLKDKITEVIKNNKIGTEFSEYGLEIFVDSIIDIIKEDE